MQVSMASQSQIAYPESTQSAQPRQQASSEEAAEIRVQKAAEAAGQGDSVKLSLQAQARLLRKQGEPVAQIASQLGLDAKTVNTYIYGQASGSPKASTPSPGGSEQTSASSNGPQQGSAVPETPETTASSPGKSNSK